jgi:hypothetical protein
MRVHYNMDAFTHDPYGPFGSIFWPLKPALACHRTRDLSGSRGALRRAVLYTSPWSLRFVSPDPCELWASANLSRDGAALDIWPSAQIRVRNSSRSASRNRLSVTRARSPRPSRLGPGCGQIRSRDPHARRPYTRRGKPCKMTIGVGK